MGAFPNVGSGVRVVAKNPVSQEFIAVGLGRHAVVFKRKTMASRVTRGQCRFVGGWLYAVCGACSVVGCTLLDLGCALCIVRCDQMVATGRPRTVGAI